MVADTETTKQATETVLKVIDALDHPHGGRILRARVLRGEPPTLRRLQAGPLLAEGPGGEERTVTVLGFPVLWGKASDRRIKRSGRVDLHVEEEGEGPPVHLRWKLRLK